MTSARAFPIGCPPLNPMTNRSTTRPSARDTHARGGGAGDPERTALFPREAPRHAGQGVCRGAAQIRAHLHVPPAPRLRDVCAADRRISLPLPPGRGCDADDPEQPGQGRGAASPRADHLRRQRRRVPELGAVPPDDEVPVGDDRQPDAGDVLGAPAGVVSVASRCPARRGDQRHGDSQLFEARRLGAHERPRGVAVRADDRRIVHVHRAAGHRPRHDDHGDERRAQTFHGRPHRYARDAVRLVGSRRHVGSAAQGGQYLGRGVGRRRDQPQGGAETPRAGVGRRTA